MGTCDSSVGNSAAMREALVEIDELTNLLDISEDKKNLLIAPSHSFVAVKIRKIIKKALEEPPRNCDVGTAGEQNDRHGIWCSKHDVNGDMEADCANNACSQCIFKWGQMPYEKGDNA